MASLPGKLQVDGKLKTLAMGLSILGLASFVVGLKTSQERAWHAYLVAFFFFTSLSVGGLFFTAIQHATKAGWSVNVRRICESFTSFLPWGLGFALIWVFGAKNLYSWLDPQIVAGDHLLQGKAAYLNSTFFMVRVLLFFGLWLFFSKNLVGRSLRQDETGDEKLTHQQLPWSVAFLVIFALSYSLFSIDALMSLEPHWFSTVFGVYCFSGLFQSTMAAMILTILFLKKRGHLGEYVTEDHLHDLGKFMFAFTVFWAYIAFSQYMLIWYANMPEETIFFEHRTVGAWVGVSFFLMLFKFVVPFIALLPRWAKRSPKHLTAVSVLILIMQFVDLYWLVYPNLDTTHTVFGLLEVGVFCGFLGVFIFAVTGFLGRHQLAAHRDPRIHESLHHHVTY